MISHNVYYGKLITKLKRGNMKTLKINLILFFCFISFSINTSAQFINGGDVKTENNWEYDGIYATWLDTTKTRSFVVEHTTTTRSFSGVWFLWWYRIPNILEHINNMV